jgi:hypothetical protein
VERPLRGDAHGGCGGRVGETGRAKSRNRAPARPNYPIKAWVNGHEQAGQQARKAGLGFAELSNGFASCDDPALLQRICDRFGPGHVQAWFDRWMTVIPLPLDAADRDAGFWWELSMRQVETSRTLVFDGDVHARAGSATFESRPWPARSPPCCSRSPASPTGACAP